MDGLVLNDVLYSESIASGHYMTNMQRPLFVGGNLTHDEQALYGFLNMGIWDLPKRECPFDSTVQSMRYTAIVGDWLWSLVELEKQRISDH